jgi:hypothetical protein
MNKGVLVWGYLASIILLLGTIFMNLDMQAGRVLYPVGFFAFNLGYLIPLFIVLFKENQENKIGIVIVFSILGFFVFLTGVSFFMVSWGGGIVLIYVGGGILLAALLSVIALSRRFYETHINSWFPIVVFGVFMVVSLLTGSVHRQVMRAFTLENKEEVELLNVLQKKNQQLYIDLVALDTLSISEYNDIKKYVDTIVDQSDKISDLIEQIKYDLISNVEGEEYNLIAGKTLDNLVPIQSNVEINSVKRFMLGRKKGKAYLIRQAIDNYRDNMLLYVPREETILNEFINANLSTQSYNLNKRRYDRTWEFQHFYGFPLITIVSQLTNLQLKIEMTQGELLNYFHKRALQLGHGQIAKVTEKK